MELCLNVPACWGPPIGVVRVDTSPCGASIAAKLAAAHPSGVTSVQLRDRDAAPVACLSWAPGSVPALVFDDDGDSPLSLLFQPPPLLLDGGAWQSAQLTTPAQLAAVVYVQQVTQQAVQILADIMTRDATGVITLGEEDEGCRKRRRVQEDAWMEAARAEDALPEDALAEDAWAEDAWETAATDDVGDNWWNDLDFGVDVLPPTPAPSLPCQTAPAVVLPVYLPRSAYSQPERSVVVCSVCRYAVI